MRIFFPAQKLLDPIYANTFTCLFMDRNLGKRFRKVIVRINLTRIFDPENLFHILIKFLQDTAIFKSSQNENIIQKIIPHFFHAFFPSLYIFSINISINILDENMSCKVIFHRSIRLIEKFDRSMLLLFPRFSTPRMYTTLGARCCYTRRRLSSREKVVGDETSGAEARKRERE